LYSQVHNFPLEACLLDVEVFGEKFINDIYENGKKFGNFLADIIYQDVLNYKS
jgi:hypothetical protein